MYMTCNVENQKPADIQDSKSNRDKKSQGEYYPAKSFNFFKGSSWSPDSSVSFVTESNWVSFGVAAERGKRLNLQRKQC